MPRLKYTSEFKSKIVLAILQGDKEFNELYSEDSLNTSMVHKWKQEFLPTSFLKPTTSAKTLNERRTA